MSEHNWKTAQRRPAKEFQPTFSMSESPIPQALNSIQEVSIGTGASSRSSAHSTSGSLSRASRDSRGSHHSSGSASLHESTSLKDGTGTMTSHSTAGSKDMHDHGARAKEDHEELLREIDNELGDQPQLDTGDIVGNGNGNGNENEHIHIVEKEETDDESEDGPVIYAQPQDDDDVSQITSSIAGNTLYSQEYMFSSISFPRGRFQTNTNRGFSSKNGSGNYNYGMPSLDGTDSGGSGGSNSFISRRDGDKPGMVTEDEDFDRFFGSSSQSGGNILAGVSGPHRRNQAKSFDDDNGLVDNTVNIYNSSNLPSKQSDEISLSDIYSYAPSTADPTRGAAMPDPKSYHSNSSNPLVWLYHQAYSLFSTARWSDRRKKNDDLDEETIDGDADYFGTLMSADFLNASPQSYPWAQQNRAKRRQSMIGFVFMACLISYLIVVSKDDIEDTRMRSQLDNTPQNVRGARRFDEPTSVGGVSEQKSKTSVNQVIGQASVQVENIAPKSTIDQSHIGTTLPDIYQNFAEVDESPTGHQPFFWHIPRTAGATVNDILSICSHKRIATNIGIAGGHHEDTDLQIVDFDGQKYVNVDIATKPGIARAVQMGFANSNLADVAISSHIHESAPLFNTSKKGKMFAFFRHPVDRAVSMFYFMQDTVWKAEASYNKELAEISIETFFSQNRGENNWKVRFLTNQLTKPYVDETDFNLAKEVLSRKCLVGLLADKEESMERFSKHFGWDLGTGKAHQCAKKKLQWDWSLRHPHEVEVVEGNRLWNLIVEQNFYDMKLYEYAQALFEEQSAMF